MEMTPSEISGFNSNIVDKMDSASGREKTAAGLGTWTRDRLREVCVVDKILTPRDITPADCQVSLNHDTLIRIENIEPESRALAITYRGMPTAKFIRAPRYAIPFYMIASDMIEKTEEELMAYRDMPLTRIIEDNIIKDMQEIKDWTTQNYFETSVQAMQYDAYGGTFTSLLGTTYNNAGTLKVSVFKGRNAVARAVALAADDFVNQPLIKPDFVTMRKAFSDFNRDTTATGGRSRRLELDKILITKTDFEDLNNFTLQDLGDRVTGEVVENGWKHATVLGIKFIVTIKTDIFKPGTVWGFCSEEFLGKSYVLQRAKFYVDKVMNVIKWASWMHVGAGIGNVAGIIKLELFSGSVVPTATTTGYEVELPLARDRLFSKNNKVDESQTPGYPAVLGLGTGTVPALY